MGNIDVFLRKPVVGLNSIFQLHPPLVLEGIETKPNGVKPEVAVLLEGVI